MESSPGGTTRTPAVDIRSGTPGHITHQSFGFYFFQPDYGGPEMQIAPRWITTDPKAVRDARAKAAQRY